MTQEKSDNKVFEFVKKHLITLLLSVALFGWTFVKDLINTGAEVKFQHKIEHIIRGQSIKTYFDSLISEKFDAKLKESLNNPLIWYDALSTNYVKEYADEKVTSIRNEVERKLLEIDSIQDGFIETLGKDLGIRNEDVIPLFSKMMRDYAKKHELERITIGF